MTSGKRSKQDVGDFLPELSCLVLVSITPKQTRLVIRESSEMLHLLVFSLM